VPQHEKIMATPETPQFLAKNIDWNTQEALILVEPRQDIYQCESCSCANTEHRSGPRLNDPIVYKMAHTKVEEILVKHVHDENFVTGVAISIERINDDRRGGDNSTTQHHAIEEVAQV
jgi:hypothetical protein